MIQQGHALTGLGRRSRRWRAWSVVLVMALTGAVGAELFCYEEHAADQHCAVCQLRHQSAAELSGSLQIEFADVAEPLERAADGELHRLRSRPPAPRPRSSRLIP